MTPPRPAASAAVALTLLLVCAGAGASPSYTLRWGDTLTSVAKKFGLPISTIASANAIVNADRVREGQQLTIPSKPPAAQPVAAQPIVAVRAPGGTAGRTHKVVIGDTLAGIAQKYNVAVDDLRKLNAITDDRRVRDGRDLQLPVSATVDAIPGDKAKPTPICPVLGAGKFDFSNSFGAPREGGMRHMGNDIFAKRGTPVVAPMGGTLRRADGHIAGLAWYIAGDDGTTFYGAHLDAISAAAGRVEQGQRIGVVGNTGDASSTPTHLHFEVHPGGGPAVDPYGYLRAWCTATR
jgi:murein DD-endopeptidase MepM/ murein hydrolase activator NlpD